MRKSYLESYYNLIPETQQKRLLDILKKRFDENDVSASDSSLEAQLENLIAQLKKPLGKPLVQYRKVKKFSKISSSDYNQTMDETYVDLGALFKQNNTINKTIKVHRLLNDTVLKDVRASIAKAENDIIVYKVIKENKTGITDVKYNTFYRNDNESVDEVYSAFIDTDTNSLKLPKGSDQSSLSIGGLAMADIDLTHYGGGIRGKIEDESHSKEKAIDEYLDSFWGEVILTDEPVRQVYDGETHFGYICEVVITLFRLDLVNYIKFDPFTNYPLTILGVYYSDSEDGEWIDTGVESKTSTMHMEFNFEEVMAKRIKIVINQKNASINTYKIPRRVINNAQLWQQIVDREYSISTETSTPIQATQDMIDYVSGWQAYVDASENFKKRVKEIGDPEDWLYRGSISETVFDAATGEMTKTSTGESADELKMDLYGKKESRDDELVEVRKYEYVYGAYNIDVRKIWYMELGEYISPMYQPNGAVVEARLDVTEIVPSGTTVEYQVATRTGEWKNILPASGYITKERLDIDNVTQTGTLRFPSESSPSFVYRNDIEVPGYEYTYDESSGDIVVGSGWYTATSAFTASYQPKGTSDIIPSGVVVSFIDDTLQYGDETIRGTASRQYKVDLDHFPYINYTIINDTTEGGATSPNFSYEEGRWLNNSDQTIEGVDSGEYYDVLSVTVDGYTAENRTDYYENIRPALTQYDLVTYPYYDYIHAGKNLYFNSELKNKEIKVRYKYLNDFVQLRILLRNNNRGNVSVTPIVEDYTLKLRTI